MSAAQHTPELRFDGCGINQADEHGTRLATFTSFNAPTTKKFGPMFAAAPETAAERDRLRESNAELLEQLKQTVDSLEYWFRRWGDPEGANSQMMQNARAAIAKAKGGAS